MKKLKKTLTLVLSFVFVLAVAFGVVSCAENDPNPSETPSVSVSASENEAKIAISSKTQVLSEGTNAAITVTTTPAGQDFDVTISQPALVAYEENGSYLHVIGRATENTEVKVTVSLVSDPAVKAEKTFTVLASSRTDEDFIVMTADTYTVKKGEPARITVSTSNNATYTVSVSDTKLVAYRNGVLSVVEEPETDTEVTVTAILNKNSEIKASKTFTVKAKEVEPTIKLKASATELAATKEGEEKNKITLTVELSVPDMAYVFTTNSDKIRVNADDNTVEIVGEIPYDTRVSVTAKLKDKPEVYSTVSILLRALVVDGKVTGPNGLDLTTAKLTDLADASLTVSGVVEDHYEVLSGSGSSQVTSYDTVVQMEEGKWKGTWKITGRKEGTEITEMYVKGTKQINYAYDSKTKTFLTGTEMIRVFVGKNNTVETKRYTTSDSIPIAWENAHLYNPAEHFSTNVAKKFEYREDFKVADYGFDENNVAAFRYKVDQADLDDLYFTTYLSYAFTPMVSDTLLDVYLMVDGNGVVGMVATSEYLLYGTTDDEGNPIDGASPTAQSYTVLNLNFSDIGSTVVENPAVFTGKIENPTTLTEQWNNQAMDLLASALEKMSGSTNYTFHAVDSTTYSPVVDESEYQVSGSTQALSASSVAVLSDSVAVRAAGSSYGRVKTYDGTVGTVGKITADGILLATTGKYDYGMDGDPLYYTDYTGYRPAGEGVYDYFEYNYDLQTLAGKKQNKGDMKDIIPQFNFSADIFKFKSASQIEGTNLMAFELVLRDVTIAKDVAMQLSMYKNAKDATSDVGSSFSVWVDELGNLVKSVYQYSLVGGTYRGYVTTTYSAIGTTTLPEDVFDGYVARSPETSWAQFTDKSFFKQHSTLCSAYGCDKGNGVYDHSGHTGTIEEVLKYIFGEDVDMTKIPTPDLFIGIFGDNIGLPGFKYKGDGTDASPYRHYMEFNISYSYSDENGKIRQEDYETIVASLKTALEQLGYTYSASNSDDNKDPLMGGSRYVTFLGNNGVEIVIENNFTRYFWIKYYHTGDWSLN